MELFDVVRVKLWKSLLWFYRALWPIHVHHQWTEISASLILVIPWSGVELRLFQITDSHFSEDPLEPWERPHAERMHQAFRGGSQSLFNSSTINPISAFRDVVDLAAGSKPDLVALTGDIVNFPQASSISWALNTLNSSLRITEDASDSSSKPIPFMYTPGNHDWFYEGSNGTQWELRHHWREARLRPFYMHDDWTSVNLDVSVKEINGMLLVAIDNSVQQISSFQLSFFLSQVLRWMPMILLLHVPLSVHEDLRPFHGYALCGDPAWGEATDRSWTHERRAPFPVKNNRATELFLEAVMAAAAPMGPLVAVLAGHVHKHAATPFGQGVPEGSRLASSGSAWGAVQYIGHAAFSGGFRLMDISTSSVDAEREQLSLQELGDALRMQHECSESLDGLARTLMAPATSNIAAARECWRDAPKGRVGIVDLQSIAAAFDAMLHRTNASVRAGLVGIGEALRPLSDHWRQGRCGAAPFNMLGVGIQRLVDVELEYVPGRKFELHGRSIVAPINAAITAFKRGEWDEFGAQLGLIIRILADAPL